MKQRTKTIFQRVLAIILLIVDLFLFGSIPYIASTFIYLCRAEIDVSNYQQIEDIYVIVLLVVFGVMWLIFILAAWLFFPAESIWVKSGAEQEADRKSTIYLAYEEILKLRTVRKRQKEKKRQIENAKQLSETLSATTIDTLHDLAISVKAEFQGNSPMRREFCDKILLQLDTSRTLIKNINLVIDKHFEKGTFTHAKYDATVSYAERTLSKNTAPALARIRSFNETSFHQMTDEIEDGSYQEDDISDDLQENSVEKLQEDIEYINARLTKNDEIISELRKLDEELKTYAGSSE